MKQERLHMHLLYAHYRQLVCGDEEGGLDAKFSTASSDSF